MEGMAMEILEMAAGVIKTAIIALRYHTDVATMNTWRGMIRGYLNAVSVLTGRDYDWDENGIYVDCDTVPIIRIE